MHMHSDVLIVGAGPAGLSLAISLAKAGFTATVLDQNPTAALEQPAPDGREIALTHPSVATLQRLGSWAGLAASEMGHIRAAHVHDGPVGAHSAMQLQAAPGTGAAPAPLDAAGVPVRVVPGVSSAMASAAAAVESFTLPEVTQSVIFTRVEGRTPMPEGESLAELARHHCTLCIFLSITLLHKVQEQLRAAGWADDAPMLVVHKASWPGEELIIRGTLADIRQRCRDAKVVSQAMVIASPNLGARHWPTLAKSKLYDASFTHRFRKASVPATPTETS